jgi:hypothetical protein
VAPTVWQVQLAVVIVPLVLTGIALVAGLVLASVKVPLQDAAAALTVAV